MSSEDANDCVQNLLAVNAAPAMKADEAAGPPAQAQTFGEGEDVEVWSVSRNEWVAAVISKLFAADCTHEGYSVKAGSLWVEYGGNSKYIPSAEINAIVRKAAALSLEDFSVQKGFISGGDDLFIGKMTVHAAIDKFEEFKGECQGFCHEGLATHDPVNIFFKRRLHLSDDQSMNWTSYRFNRSAVSTAPPVYSYILQPNRIAASEFQLLEAVEVYSNSQERWVPANVVEIWADGGVRVQYGEIVKDLLREYCNSSSIRKVAHEVEAEARQAEKNALVYVLQSVKELQQKDHAALAARVANLEETRVAALEARVADLETTRVAPLEAKVADLETIRVASLEAKVATLEAQAVTCKTAQTFEEGEHVEVWSVSRREWVAAVISKLFAADSTPHEGYSVEAGALLVVYNDQKKHSKYIPPDHISDKVRKAALPSATRHGETVLRPHPTETKEAAPSPTPTKADFFSDDTGQGSEDEIHSKFCKLYCYVGNKWEEKGTGEAKLLKRKKTRKVRFMFEQEKTRTILSNHLVVNVDPYCNLHRNANGDRCRVWSAQECADNETKVETLALKFCTSEQANDFEKEFNNAKHSTKP